MNLFPVWTVSLKYLCLFSGMCCNFIIEQLKKDLGFHCQLNIIKYAVVPTPLKIAITKEIIRKSKNCGTKNDAHTIGNNCAIAIALADIFPNIYVNGYHIFPFGMEYKNGQDLSIPMPVIAQQFVKLFDGFCLTPNLRLLLPEFDFILDIPDEVIEQINIDEVRELIAGDKKIPACSFSTRSCLCEPSLV